MAITITASTTVQPTVTLAVVAATAYTLDDLTTRVESFVADTLGATNSEPVLRFTQVLSMLAKSEIWPKSTDHATSIAHANRILIAFNRFAPTANQHNLHRKFLTVIVMIMQSAKHASLCKLAVEGTVRTALVGHENKRLLNACNHTLGALQQAHPFLTAHFLSATALAIIREDASMRGTLIHIVKGWQAQALKLLSRAPIPWDSWQELVRSLTSSDQSTKKWQRQWDPTNGHVHWHDEECSTAMNTSDDVDYDFSNREKHMSWNANSLNQRFDSGDLINLLVAHKPTTISISEIKTSLVDFSDPEGLQHVLKTLGYRYCAFNWCTQAQANGTKGSGNFGIAVFSRVPLLDLHFGVGHERLDKEGRAITATIGERTFVWVYAPCSRFDVDAERSILRRE
jgi:hypothetical protein